MSCSSSEQAAIQAVEPPTVAVIGCGPGGMFFLHALASKRRALRAQGDEAGFAALPKVTCFEQASVPGGVWRARTAAPFIAKVPTSPPSSLSKELMATKIQSKDSDGKKEKKYDFEEPVIVYASRDPLSDTSLEQSDGDRESPESSSDYDDDSTIDYDDDDRTIDPEEEEASDFTIGAQAQAPSTNMYEALWTNGPKEAIEFADYTFDEHFGHALPVYMPRGPLLEYMLARVTRHEPTLFEEFVKFDTAVHTVNYDENLKKFEVSFTDNKTGINTTGYYDKCLWAAGHNGRPFIPKAISQVLVEGKFSGKAMHSSNVGDFDDGIRGKNILLVGDSYSAEDVALTAIKRGAHKIYICSRSSKGAASYMAAWPMDKVQMLGTSVPTAVIQEGKGIRCREVAHDMELETYHIKGDGKVWDLKDISTVLFCTGYRTNLTMLDKSLREEVEDYDSWKMDMPEGWKMKENPLTKDLGDESPPMSIYPNYGSLTPGLFRGALVSNPNMMYVTNISEAPLMEIDVVASLMLGYVTGEIRLPPQAEMERLNLEQVLAAMDVPYARYYIDDSYRLAVDGLGKEHWVNDSTTEGYRALETSAAEYYVRLVAHLKNIAGFPDDLGDFEKLNERGQALVEMDVQSGYDRYNLDPKNPEQNQWRTFRDVQDAEKNFSIHTGTRAVDLKARWLDLDDDDKEVHLNPNCKLSK
jgi:hypothetical protein